MYPPSGSGYSPNDFTVDYSRKSSLSRPGNSAAAKGKPSQTAPKPAPTPTPTSSSSTLADTPMLGLKLPEFDGTMNSIIEYAPLPESKILQRLFYRNGPLVISNYTPVAYYTNDDLKKMLADYTEEPMYDEVDLALEAGKMISETYAGNPYIAVALELASGLKSLGLFKNQKYIEKLKAYIDNGGGAVVYNLSSSGYIPQKNLWMPYP